MNGDFYPSAETHNTNRSYAHQLLQFFGWLSSLLGHARCSNCGGPTANTHTEMEIEYQDGTITITLCNTCFDVWLLRGESEDLHDTIIEKRLERFPKTFQDEFRDDITTPSEPGENSDDP